VPAQNATEFKSMLEKALAVDVEADQDNRLANIVAQRRAKWLLDHVKDLFLDQETRNQNHACAAGKDFRR